VKERFVLMMLNSFWKSSFVGTDTYRQFAAYYISASREQQSNWQLYRHRMHLKMFI